MRIVWGFPTQFLIGLLIEQSEDIKWIIHAHFWLDISRSLQVSPLLNLTSAENNEGTIKYKVKFAEMVVSCYIKLILVDTATYSLAQSENNWIETVAAWWQFPAEMINTLPWKFHMY